MHSNKEKNPEHVDEKAEHNLMNLGSQERGEGLGRIRTRLEGMQINEKKNIENMSREPQKHGFLDLDIYLSTVRGNLA